MIAVTQARAAWFPRVHHLDLIISAGLALTTAALAWYLQQHLLFTNASLDTWFDSDSNYVIDQMTNRFSPQNNTASRHPLMAFLIFPLSWVLHQFGMEPAQAAMPTTAIISALFVVTMYWLLRLMGRPFGVALAFAGILAASAPGIILLGIHERIIVSAVTVIVFLIALKLHERAMIGAGWLTAAAALTLAATVTNFFVAIIALPLVLGWKRGLQGLVNAFAAVTVLALVGQAVFPHSTPFPATSEMRDPLNHTTLSGDPRMEMGGSITDRITVIALHSAAVPTPAVVQKPEGYHILSVQRVGMLGQQPIWYLAVAAWLGLLAAGSFVAFKEMRASALLTQQGLTAATRGDFHGAFPWVVVLALGAQIGLFMTYGQEVILFSAYYVPFMVVIAAMAWRPGPAGRIVFGAAMLLLGLLALNNGLMFANALEPAKALVQVSS
jgi:hypothetical protein